MKCNESANRSKQRVKRKVVREFAKFTKFTNKNNMLSENEEKSWNCTYQDGCKKIEYLCLKLFTVSPLEDRLFRPRGGGVFFLEPRFLCKQKRERR